MRADDPRWGCCHPGCDAHPANNSGDLETPSVRPGGPIHRISPKGEAWVGACGDHYHLYAESGQNP